MEEHPATANNTPEELVELFTLKVLTPEALDQRTHVLMKPFILYTTLPRQSIFLGVCSLPNLLEVMGMSSGGGPPGFTVQVPKMSEKEPKQPPHRHFIAGFIPGATVRSDISVYLGTGTHIGMCVSAGIVLNYFELVIGDDEIQEASEEEVAALFLRNGYTLIRLVEYTTPDLLLGRLGAPPPAGG